MRFNDIKKLNDEKLLILAKKVYTLANKGRCDEMVENWFINEVSARKYGFEDVMGAKDGNDLCLCLDENEEFVKIVKERTANKWIRDSDKIGKYGNGRSWYRVGMIDFIIGNDCGQLFII